MKWWNWKSFMHIPKLLDCVANSARMEGICYGLYWCFVFLWCIAHLSCSKLITTSSDKTARIYDVLHDFKLLNTLGGHGAWVWDCSFSGDSAYVVTGTHALSFSWIYIYIIYYVYVFCIQISAFLCIYMFVLRLFFGSVSSDKIGRLWDANQGRLAQVR